jgi:hypothetical protein
MTKRRINKRSYLTSQRAYLAAVLLVVVIASLIYFLFIHKSSQSSQTTGTTTADGSKVNLSPATSSDKSSNAAHKSEILQKDQQLQNNNGQSSSISVVITDASNSVVKAYISGVFEDGGSCTATATQGLQKVTASSSGFENVSYTQCAPLYWSSTLGPGNWSITVNYKSASSQGSQTINKSL